MKFDATKAVVSGSIKEAIAQGLMSTDDITPLIDFITKRMVVASLSKQQARIYTILLLCGPMRAVEVGKKMERSSAQISAAIGFVNKTYGPVFRKIGDLYAV